MRTLSYILATALWMTTLSSLAVRAQQQPQDQGQQQTPSNQGTTQPAEPIPAYHSPMASAAGNEDEENDTELQPDTRALTGVENFSLGISTTRTYWQPHFDFFSTVDSNPQENAGGTSGWGTWTSFDGGIDLHRNWANSQLGLNYLGGGMISNNGTANNGVIQGLTLSEKLTYRRWDILFFDQLSYLPEAGLGFGGLGGTVLPGGGAQGIGNGLAPGQGILTGQEQNLANTFDTEVDVFLSARSSLTFVGGYSLLHYFGSGFVNYGTDNFRAGYNYQKDRKNTMGLAYTFGDFQYGGVNQSITTHTFQAWYGRRVTGRLAIQVGAGPEVAFYNLPITGGTGGEGGTPGTGSSTQVYWALNTSLQYQIERTGFNVAYTRGVAGGAGVLAGALTNTVSGGVTRQMSRTFSSGVTGGYSRNQGLATGGVAPVNQTYNYSYVGANLAHPIGRTLALTLTYQLQYQTANAAFCIGPDCGKSLVRNLISFGVGWHERPLLF